MARRSRSGVTAVMGGSLGRGRVAWAVTVDGLSSAPCRPCRPAAPAPLDGRAPRIVVLGDLVLDVVMRPDRSLEHGTDVPGRVSFVQGGSAATTARWLGRLGARIVADRRGRAGRGRPGARRRPSRPTRSRRASSAWPGRGPGGSASSSTPDGERSFVADRGAALQLGPDDLKAGMVRRRRCRSTCRSTPCSASRSAAAGRRAIELARAAGASGQPRPRLDRAAARRRPPGGTRRSSPASRRTSCSRRPPRPRRCSGGRAIDGLLDFAADRRREAGRQGRHGPRPERRRPAALRGGDRRDLAATDTTGAGDAFDAGFLVGWFAARAAGRRCRRRSSEPPWPAIARRARQLSTPRAELPLA